MAGVLYISEDMTLTVTGLSAGGSALNAAAITYALKTAAGATVAGGTGSYSYVSASSGNYSASLESTVTALLTEGAQYYLEVTGAQGAYDFFRRVPLRACYRDAT